MLKFLLFIALVSMVLSQDPRCGPPRPVAPGSGGLLPDGNICPDCPEEGCPSGEVCCPLGICGSGCFRDQTLICPPGLDPTFCLIPPCDTASCPRFPNAECVNDFCGDCNAVFRNQTTQEVIPQFSCDINSRWPECLLFIRCPRPPFTCSSGCPRVPDAVCSFNCDCNFVFTDRRTGIVLSAEDCGREFDERCPPVPFNGFERCSVCPRTCPEGQICCPNGCFGGPTGSACRPIPGVTCPLLNIREVRSDCTNGNNEGSSCRLSCDPNRFLIGTNSIECQNNGQWSPSLNGIRCIRERDFDSRCPAVQPIRPANCPVCPTSCPNGQICCRTGCPGASECIPVPTRPTCPPDRPVVNCFDSPCRTASCPGYPGAVCTDDFCGGCNAVFTDPSTGQVIPKFACQRGSNWPACLASILCPVSECETGCPNQPNAECNTNCDCSLVFSDSRTGDVFSQRECRSFPSNCPAQPPLPSRGCTGIEPTCRRPCPRPLVCCPVGCGSQCIDLTPPTTPEPTTATRPSCFNKPRIPHLRYRCSFTTFGQYYCRLSCTIGYKLDGPRFISCIRGTFPSLDEVECKKMPSKYRPCSSCGR